MRNLTGCFCITAGSIWLLLNHKKKNQRRSVVLNDMIKAFRNIADGVRLERMPLPELLKKAGTECGTEVHCFLERIADAAEQGESMLSAWKKGAAEFPLSKAERYVILNMVNCLRKDEISLCNGMERGAAALETYRDLWEREKAENERRVSALCLSGAALLIILLI